VFFVHKPERACKILHTLYLVCHFILFETGGLLGFKLAEQHPSEGALIVFEWVVNCRLITDFK
jgi:hypothetical protein